MESAGDAIKGAGAALNKKNRKENTASIEIMGHPGLMAGMTVSLAGFGDFSGKYLIDKAEHKVGSGGYTTSLELSKCRLKPDVLLKAKSQVLTTRPVVPVAPPVNALDKWEREFELFKEFRLLAGVDDMARLLLCLPAIAGEMAENKKGTPDAQGWLYLRSMLQRWFGSNGSTIFGGAEPFWVDWEWVMGYARARTKYVTFTGAESDPWGSDAGESHVMNDAARNSLGRILCRDGYMRDKRTDFDFISLPWTEWQAAYHTLTSVSRVTPPDGLTTALGAFTLRALAKGWTEPDGHGGHIVHVTGMAVFVHDSFNFEEEGVGANYLGAWSCENLSYSHVSIPGHTALENANFRNFRESYVNGGDFLILSQPHKVENFTEERYDYTCAN
ncbi:MAG: DUF6402 family protein [Desulfovibrio sp.]|nr:DUF6402 family protein [Desulfovibrio sp.]